VRRTGQQSSEYMYIYFFPLSFEKYNKLDEYIYIYYV